MSLRARATIEMRTYDRLEPKCNRYREALEWISENDPDDGVVVTGRRGIFGVRARDALSGASTALTETEASSDA